MSEVPHTRAGVWPADLPESRVASAFARQFVPGCSVALIGLADDLGIRLNNGRLGARDGPSALRAALSRYGVAEPRGWAWPRVFDAGDVIAAEGTSEASLLETHQRVTEATEAVLELGLFPIAIGGGHDLTFPFVRAVARRWPGLAGVYFDPHLDVRDQPGSGMPFRRLIEECGVRDLRIHGFSPLVNAREHVEWFLAHGGQIGASDTPTARDALNLPRGVFFASFDLDVLDSACAPGVSALNPCGWLPAKAEAAVLSVAQHPGVRCFDIMELCPAHDAQGRTARLAAHLFLTFLRGMALRGTTERSP